jgi:hypothetical protein
MELLLCLPIGATYHHQELKQNKTPLTKPISMKELWQAIPVLAQMVLIYVAIAAASWAAVKVGNKIFPEEKK